MLKETGLSDEVAIRITKRYKEQSQTLEKLTQIMEGLQKYRNEFKANRQPKYKLKFREGSPDQISFSKDDPSSFSKQSLAIENADVFSQKDSQRGHQKTVNKRVSKKIEEDYLLDSSREHTNHNRSPQIQIELKDIIAQKSRSNQRNVQYRKTSENIGSNRQHQAFLSIGGAELKTVKDTMFISNDKRNIDQVENLYFTMNNEDNEELQIRTPKNPEVVSNKFIRKDLMKYNRLKKRELTPLQDDDYQVKSLLKQQKQKSNNKIEQQEHFKVRFKLPELSGSYTKSKSNSINPILESTNLKNQNSDKNDSLTNIIDITSKREYHSKPQTRQQDTANIDLKQLQVEKFFDSDQNTLRDRDSRRNKHRFVDTIVRVNQSISSEQNYDRSLISQSRRNHPQLQSVDFWKAQISRLPEKSQFPMTSKKIDNKLLHSVDLSFRPAIDKIGVKFI
ncbi:UNKNOWN [Stylonychia lemnae]|uniref:Uncharacterized protein n=1 Tax=Stylonychia lemnae TaxID=5949 RepID=A0A077ZTL7_STYLE|nr:UNKNOWN [Stylonychia lemnae]|eukprot:CDW72680.1 UNKNOWN [Stylonychia lemnae]